MSPLTPEKKAATRERILTEGAKLLREAGITGASVEKVMKAAGLTVGGFYAHFDSKDDLVAELLAKAFLESAGRTHRSAPRTGPEPQAETPADRLRRRARSYLSREHRDHPATGCPLPATLSGLATLGGPARQVLERGIEGMAAQAMANLDGAPAEKRQKALAYVALLVGGLTLSRALGPTPFSDEILKACRDRAVPDGADT